MIRKVRLMRVASVISILVLLTSCDPFGAAWIRHDLKPCKSIILKGLDSEQAADVVKAINPIATKYGLAQRDCRENNPSPDFQGKYLVCYRGTGHGPFGDAGAVEYYNPDSIEMSIYGWSSQIKAHGHEAIRQFGEAIQRVTASWKCS